MQASKNTEPELPARRHFLRVAGAAGACSLGLPSHLVADPAADELPKVKEKTADELMTKATRTAVEKGLRFLAGKQVQRGNDRGAFGATGYAGSVGICGLGGLAFMSEGSTPGVGRFGKQVDLCADFLTRHTGPTGYIARGSGAVGNMYAHGFAMLCMSQAYGMSRKRELGQKLRLAVKCTLAAQNDQGGWRYRPVKSDADLSVTVCQIMALRAARDSGINVPDSARDKCIEYVKKSQTADGSFRYTMRGGHTTFALTGAGLVSLFSAGIYDGQQIEKGLKYLKRRKDSAERHYFYYGHYYAVQAMWHAGGNYWNDWYPSIRDKLLSTQSASGAWTNSSYGAEFATAMACIILQMPNDMLPIFAR
jgi:hypothetical protein